MQTLGKDPLAFFSLLLIFSLLSCTKKPDAFDKAIAKHRNSLVDQVNTAGEGVPFFTIATLNPVWSISEKTPIVTIPSFKLTDQDGKERDEKLFQGKISVVGFIFATCSGFCPFLVEGMKSVEQELEGVASDVQFVAFTVNPEEDTPAKLKDYAKERKLNTQTHWTLLTGDKKTIYSLAKDTFASQVFKRQTEDTNFVHSEHLYVIDQEGRLRGILNGTRIDLRRDAKALVAQLPHHSAQQKN